MIVVHTFESTLKIDLIWLIYSWVVCGIYTYAKIIINWHVLDVSDVWLSFVAVTAFKLDNEKVIELLMEYVLQTVLWYIMRLKVPNNSVTGNYFIHKYVIPGSFNLFTSWSAYRSWSLYSIFTKKYEYGKANLQQANDPCHMAEIH